MITPELAGFVRQQLAQGVAPEQLRQTLAAKGWSSEDITDVLQMFSGAPTAPPSSPIPAKATGSHSRALFITISLVVLALLILGAYAALRVGVLSSDPIAAPTSSATVPTSSDTISPAQLVTPGSVTLAIGQSTATTTDGFSLTLTKIEGRLAYFALQLASVDRSATAVRSGGYLGTSSSETLLGHTITLDDLTPTTATFLITAVATSSLSTTQKPTSSAPGAIVDASSLVQTSAHFMVSGTAPSASAVLATLISSNYAGPFDLQSIFKEGEAIQKGTVTGVAGYSATPQPAAVGTNGSWSESFSGVAPGSYHLLVYDLSNAQSGAAPLLANETLTVK